MMNAVNMRSISYGRKTIDFALFHSDRKTMEIAVMPNCEVVVKAPLESDIIGIEKNILKRARWIIKQLRYFEQFNPKTPARCYITGESHLYLGKQYRLKSVKGDENLVRLSHGFFIVSTCGVSTPEKIRKLMTEWYLDKANHHFAESLERCWREFDNPALHKPKIFIRKMRKSWGKLSSKGVMTLNSELIKAPKECIDYVITHELCHIRHHDHGQNFQKLLFSLIPDWERVKSKLELTLV